jgi:hypothetical protein
MAWPDRVAADYAMRTELENIADPGDRNCGLGLERLARVG